MLFLVKDPPGQRPSGSTTKAGERFLNYWWFLWRLWRLYSYKSSWIIDDFSEDSSQGFSLPGFPHYRLSHPFWTHKEQKGSKFSRNMFLISRSEVEYFFQIWGGGLDKATQDLYDLKGWWLGDDLDYIISNLQRSAHLISMSKSKQSYQRLKSCFLLNACSYSLYSVVARKSRTDRKIKK